MLFFTVIPALSGVKEFDEAEFYFRQQCYDQAITEYLRFLFFHPDDPAKSEAHAKIALAGIAEGDWRRAEKHIRLSIQTAGTREEQYSRTFFLTEFLIARQRYTEAANELDALGKSNPGEPERMRRLFLLGVTSVYLGRWTDASAHFSEYFNQTDTYPKETEERVLRLLTFAVQTHYKDPQAARVLSYIIPGSGQIYAGDFIQGINSLFVTGLTGALAVWAIVGGDYLDAAGAVFFIFQRFYFGSPYNAQRIAAEYNQNKKNAIARGIFDLLLQ
jgi:tetratricopeptide (TPR) repeat protein